MAVETETIRNVCLIGHRGSGKTSIAEGMIGLASVSYTHLTLPTIYSV